jgi:hypothetical protein
MAEEGDVVLGLASAFGAVDSSSQCISIYVPNKDCQGAEIGNQRQWVLEAIHLLCEINGGATAMPPVEGAGWVTRPKSSGRAPSSSIPSSDLTNSFRSYRGFENSFIAWAEKRIRARLPLSSTEGFTVYATSMRRKRRS